MDRRLRLAAMVAACVCTLTFTAVAYAYVTTDMNNFNLTESTTTWPSQFHVSTGSDGLVSWRWLDYPDKATVISANRCSDLAAFGISNYGVGDTSYHGLFWGTTGQCFMIRGRTAAGQGSLVNHDGRVQR
jgi:hypothetical protein